jgi:hypothetical protein
LTLAQKSLGKSTANLLMPNSWANILKPLKLLSLCADSHFCPQSYPLFWWIISSKQ